MSTPEPPPYVTALVKGRPDGAARRVTGSSVPADVELWRASWTYHGYDRGGFTRARTMVRWIAYVHGVRAGEDTSKRLVLDYARAVERGRR